MDWEKRLKDLSDYEIAFEIKKGYYHVSLKYKNNWEVITPDNDLIYLEERGGVYHYIASTDSVFVNDIFKLIDDTIDYNIDLQRKLELFKKKTEELREIFANENFDVLETIEFKYGKKNTKRKYRKKTDINENGTLESDNIDIKQDQGGMNDTPNGKNNNVDSKPLITEGQVDKTDEIAEDDEIVPMNDEYMEELERK